MIYERIWPCLFKHPPVSMFSQFCHESDHSVKPRSFPGLSTEGQKLFLAWSLIGLAILLHFICCDWRMPDEGFLNTGELYRVSCDNQIVGMIHAGRLFRECRDGATFYNMGGTFWLGVMLPVFLAYPGIMVILSTYLPPKCEIIIRKLRNKLLIRKLRISKASPASVVSVFFLSCLLATTLTAAVTTAIQPNLIEVKSERDSVALADREAERKAASSSSPAQDNARRGWVGGTSTPSNSSTDGGCSSPTSVPEPGTWILLLLAAGSLGVARYWSHTTKNPK